MTTKGPILASQIVQKTINDFTKHPERWIQESWSDGDTRALSYEEQEAIREAYARATFIKVRQPHNGMKNSRAIFADMEDVFTEPVTYCGLGGIRQSAYRLNKADFWERKFQKELAWAGAYLEGEATTREIPPEDDDEENEPVQHFAGFVEFNDHHATTLKDVLALMRKVVKQLKEKEAVDLAKAEEKAALKAAALA